ncbi:MAG: alanyl-tRNA editing protein [Candidatus Thorarchaeota archaeon]
MTEILYMTDNYLREFEASITGVTKDSIILNKSAFYSEGGGQIGDTGILKDDRFEVKVLNTLKREEEIHHIISGVHSFKVGDSVTGVLNWNQRYECMRFHTAQHILSRYLQINYGLETVGNQISCGTSRADYSPLDQIDDDMKQRVAEGVNEILAMNLPVNIQFMPRRDAIEFLKERGYQYRYLEMVPQHVTDFRIITIGDYDAASCAGTHVANTKEIGTIRIGKAKNVGSGKRRIYFSLS